MTRISALRESRVMHVAIGASALAVPASAAALADATPAIQAGLQTRKLTYGHDVVLTGRAPASAANQTVALEFAAPGSGRWRQLSSGRVHPDGSFHLTAPLKRSGSVRVTATGAASSSLGTGAARDSATSSLPLSVSVQAAIRLRARSVDAQPDQPVSVRGRVLPGTSGRRVLLQQLRSGRWVTVARAHTGGRGGFSLRYRAGGSGHARLRVHFTGDPANTGASRPVRVTVYSPSAASWYDDAGSTACGFHAHYGVANLSLPCGTRVRFRSGGRSVTAVVDDRGPYVGGRVWDLNQNTAAALGFGGVGTVWASL